MLSSIAVIWSLPQPKLCSSFDVLFEEMGYRSCFFHLQKKILESKKTRRNWFLETVSQESLPFLKSMLRVAHTIEIVSEHPENKRFFRHRVLVRDKLESRRLLDEIFLLVYYTN